MTEIDYRTIIVFVQDRHGNSIPGARVEAFLNDSEDAVAGAITAGETTKPVHMQIPASTEFVRLQAIKDGESKQVTVDPDVGTVAIQFDSITVPVDALPGTNPWISGSFYLVAMVVTLATVAIIGGTLPWYSIPVVFLAGLLIFITVGVLQLRNDETLKDQSFVELIKEVLKRTPLLRKFVDSDTTA